MRGCRGRSRKARLGGADLHSAPGTHLRRPGEGQPVGHLIPRVWPVQRQRLGMSFCCLREWMVGEALQSVHLFN